jgi:outer membrane protein assembly factor BamE (lipoprotein component of BamABCDE complex)
MTPERACVRSDSGFPVDACARCARCHFSFPKVANVAVQQGNVITQEMVDQLQARNDAAPGCVRDG